MNGTPNVVKVRRIAPVPHGTLRCAIYARKSNEDDATEELRSVTRQVERSREYAARKGWRSHPDLVFVDDGISGAEFKRRPGLARLLTAAEAHAFDALVMSEPSRLGHEQAETTYVLKRLNDAGAQVWYYLEDRRAQLDTAVGKLMSTSTLSGRNLSENAFGSAPLMGCANGRRQVTAQAERSTGTKRFPYTSRADAIPTGTLSPTTLTFGSHLRRPR
jgi:hypothetical protein